MYKHKVLDPLTSTKIVKLYSKYSAWFKQANMWTPVQQDFKASIFEEVIFPHSEYILW